MGRATLIFAATLAVTGCMGGDGGGVSREDYVSRADGVCGDYQVRLSRIPPPISGSPTELAVYLDRALPIAREQLDELRDIPRPEDQDDRRRVNRLLALLEEELDLNDAARRAAKNGDTVSAQTGIGQAGTVSAEAARLAEELGFVVCARRD